MKRKKPSFNRKLLLSENSPFAIKEDYNIARSNILFSFPDDDTKVIAITSSSGTEGKSTNLINLATSFAQLGKRVVVVDCDLRFPTVAEKLQLTGVNGGKGLTDVVVRRATLEDVLIDDERRHIWILGAGTIPPDPTRLLCSSAMREVIEELKRCFDYVFLDCPPAAELIDAALLSPLVDGYLLLVKQKSSDHRNINRMLMQLQRVDAKILGFLLVNVPPENRKHYGKYKRL